MKNKELIELLESARAIVHAVNNQDNIDISEALKYNRNHIDMDFGELVCCQSSCSKHVEVDPDKDFKAPGNTGCRNCFLSSIANDRVDAKMDEVIAQLKARDLLGVDDED